MTDETKNGFGNIPGISDIIKDLENLEIDPQNQQKKEEEKGENSPQKPENLPTKSPEDENQR